MKKWEKKVEVFDKSKNLSLCKIASIYGCGATQVNEINEQWLKCVNGKEKN